MPGLMSAWIVELALITYRSTRKGAEQNIAGLPLPADYLATFAVFGALGLLGRSADNLAAVVGWGFVIATALNLFDPTLAAKGGTAQSQPTGTLPSPPTGTQEGATLGKSVSFLKFGGS